MIKIVNDGNDAEGMTLYRVQVNNQHICTFKHNREDGLADCLQKAADAVELSEWADYVLTNDSKGG